jgi:hypothetical protein
MNSFGLSMVQDYFYILKQQQFELLEKVLEQTLGNRRPKFHIYMIVSRPRVSFDVNSLHASGQIIQGRYKVQEQDKFSYVPFRFVADKRLGDLKSATIECSYPFDEIVVRQGNQVVLKGLAGLLLLESGHSSIANDLKVLYVGQAYGESGEREATTRLSNHSTLQKIYSETPPDKEVWITLWRFNRNSVMFLPPEDYDPNNTEMFERYFNHMLAPKEFVSESHEINITEAALIRYFQPRYNSTFKYNFPSKGHLTYSQCYQLGLDYVGVELNTSNMNMNLWSDVVRAGHEHTILFSLKTEMDVMDMFRIKE